MLYIWPQFGAPNTRGMPSNAIRVDSGRLCDKSWLNFTALDVSAHNGKADYHAARTALTAAFARLCVVTNPRLQSTQGRFSAIKSTPKLTGACLVAFCRLFGLKALRQLIPVLRSTLPLAFRLRLRCSAVEARARVFVAGLRFRCRAVATLAKHGDVVHTLFALSPHPLKSHTATRTCPHPATSIPTSAQS
ncbi:hypothetical protein DFH06DRAFT_1405918 [Mycena polygramma]|nr:hypothetical protein DFH06DRAFT_1316476 [Mycena polygramma]KAJ7681038.1 hypothetical protein DFH06DRAFT_1405918 [Mycena polygramma]